MHRFYELLIIFITTSRFTGLSFAGPKLLQFISQMLSH
ncbi:MAG: hypothetical protein ACI910_001844 [Oleispira sp.]|jgi:hypothetical protein